MAQQVGRISGPLLTSNLERNGKDIDFRNQQNSIPTLKLDVNNGYVGVNTSAPAVELDVVTTINGNFYNLDSLNVGNLNVSGDTITALAGDLTFVDPVVQSENRTQQIRMQGNKIETYVTNASLNFLPNGTGTVELLSDTRVDANLHATGDITLDGSIILGDSSVEDTFAFNADIDSNFVPDAHFAFDIGTLQKTFNHLHTTHVNGELTFTESLNVAGINWNQPVGNTFYVQINGNDTNAGDHFMAPFRTIQRALQAADSSAGGPVTILVSSGEYDETLPIIVPPNVSIVGEDLRNTIIRPDTASQGEDVFLLDGETTIQNLTIKDFYYDSGNDTGYAFRFRPNATITSRSPYIQNVTVSTKGSNATPSNPLDYASEDAGRAVKADGAVVTANSQEASMLFHSFTAITPGAKSVILTNGVRVEWLNSFVYFAKEGIRVENGSTGRISADGSTINYGGELRCMSSANIYGGKGIIADGSDCLVYLVGHTFSYIGTEDKTDNDASQITTKVEYEEINNGKVVGTYVDKAGDFNVGDVFYVNQETGDVVMKSVDFDFTGVQQLVITTRGSVVTIDSTKIQTDNVRFRNNVMESITGNLVLDSGLTNLNITGNTTITGTLDITGDLTIGGALVRLGDDGTDSITISAEVENDLIPNLSGVYNLGSIAKNWRTIFSDVLVTDGITFEGNKIFTVDSNADLELNASGTGQVIIPIARVDSNLTVDGNVVSNPTSKDVVTQSSSEFTIGGDITVANSSFYTNVNTQTLTVPSTAAQTNIGPIKIDDNTITTTQTNADLELRPSGTGIVRVVGDLEVSNTLFAPNANYSLVSASMEATSANHLVVTNRLQVNGLSINESISISGNKIETNTTNADLELLASGTGEVVIQENLLVENNFTVNGTTTFVNVPANSTTATTITTTNISTPGMTFDNVEFRGNLIQTNNTNSDLELRANGTGEVIVQENFILDENFTVSNDTSFQTVISPQITADNLTVNTDITMPSNMTVEGVSFVGNAITSNTTNSDLDLRASGTGTVRFGEDVTVTNDLTVNGETTFTNISNNNQTANNIIVESIVGNEVQFENININGNRIQTTLSNSNLELQSAGTGVLRFKEQLNLGEGFTVNGTLTVGGITINDDVSLNELELSSNIRFDDNYIATTESNSDLELRANGTGDVWLSNLKFQNNTVKTDDDSTNVLEITADKMTINSTDSIVIPRGTVDLNADSTLNADIRYDTSINEFVGKRGSYQTVFGGVYSDDLQTRIKVLSDTNTLNFDVDGNTVMSMNAIGETYVNRIELSGSDSTPGGIDIDGNTIQTNWTNADIILAPEGGTGRVGINDIQFLDNTVYSTGANAATLQATGKGYIKFAQDSAVVIPFGASGTREPNPEIGHTRWNTALNFVEVYTSGGWVTAAGASQGISTAEMDELMNEYILIFG